MVADTKKHKEFFEKTLLVNRKKIFVLYVGAEESLFSPMEYPKKNKQFEVLFYGSFLELHGVDIIMEAAKLCTDINIKWTLLGDGDLKKIIEKEIALMDNISIEPWIAYEDLSKRMAKANVLLGVFGKTLLSELVIPNKAFQAMAIARPLITGLSKAYPKEILNSGIISFIELGSPKSLAKEVRKYFKEKDFLEERALKVRNLFNDFFSYEKLENLLKKILS